MNHLHILKRSWTILWSYKALWVFGILLALTTASGYNGGGGGSSAGGGGGSSFLFPSQPQLAQPWSDLSHHLSRLSLSAQSAHLDPWAIALIILGSLLALALAILLTIARYVSQVALIRMVDIHEDTAEKLTWRQGFRLGWCKAAWRLFLISFFIGLAAFLIFTLLFGLAALPVIFGSLADNGLQAVGILITIGLALPVLLLAILTAVLVSLVMETVRRACVLEDLGVGASLRRGLRLVRQHFTHIGLMWLLTLGIRLGLALALIPLVFIVGGLALLLGGLLGGLVYLVTAALAAGWVYAVALGGLLFIAILGIPLTFVGGLLQTYLSSTWTLTYRTLTVQ
jgi:hypothetical protein